MRDVAPFIGKPFADGGRGPDAFDCWGLVMAVRGHFGLATPEYHVSCFASLAINRLMAAPCAHGWRRCPSPDDLAVVVLRTSEEHPGLCTHAGVVVGDGCFIHTFAKSMSVLARLDNPVWANRIAGVYQWNG